MDYADRMRDIMAILKQVDHAMVQEAKEDEQPEPGTEDQKEIDQTVDDLMTTPREPAQSAVISVSSLADDLGVSDTDAFKKAFNTARASQPITEASQLQALADAFLKLMVTDAGTTQRVLNRMRAIYKKPNSNA